MTSASTTPNVLPETRTTTLLLDSLRSSGDSVAWEWFYTRYRPVIEGVARRLGLSRETAEDVAQQTMADFAAAYRAGKYERGRGRLRSFLIAIAHHRAVDAMRARRPREHQMASRIDAADEKTLTSAWDAERLRVISARAMEELRESPRSSGENIDAFEMIIMRGLSYEEVSVATGIPVDNLYVVKNRLTPRLREIIQRMTEEYDRDE
ncbi:MAG: RNA polymerase sigma factor [Phycisphaerae bacterium]|nr:RNA polymerase sigma factor [Phycisphaerae bacterium]